MSSRKVFLIILLIILVATAIFFVSGKKPISLVSPTLRQDNNQQPVTQSSPESSSPSYNPPREIKYDIYTDLKQELESINPEILESDF